MHTSLFIPVHTQSHCLNITKMVNIIILKIKEFLPVTKHVLTRRVTRIMDFTNTVINVSASVSIFDSLNSHNTWLNTSILSIMVNLHTFLMREKFKDMIFSQNKAENTDTEVENDIIVNINIHIYIFHSL